MDSVNTLLNLHPTIEKWFWRWTQDKQLALDLTQELYVKVLPLLERVPPEAVLSFCRNTARHMVIDHYRKTARRATVLQADVQATGGDIPTFSRMELEKVFSALQPNFREALVCRLLGFKDDEVRGEVPRATWKIWVFRARKKAREVLEAA